MPRSRKYVRIKYDQDGEPYRAENGGKVIVGLHYASSTDRYYTIPKPGAKDVLPTGTRLKEAVERVLGRRAVLLQHPRTKALQKAAKLSSIPVSKAEQLFDGKVPPHVFRRIVPDEEREPPKPRPSKVKVSDLFGKSKDGVKLPSTVLMQPALLRSSS